MTVLLNATANVSENEGAVFLVQVWLNGIVEAFDDGNCELPIKAADHSRPCTFQVNSTVQRDNGDMFYSSWLSYSTTPKWIPIM